LETPVWTLFTHDVLGRETRVDFSDGTFTQKTYDHHEITFRDQRGNLKRTHLDSYHRIREIEEINGGQSYFTTYEYDAADKLLKVTNAANHNTFNVYDTMGRKIAMCDPNMGTPSNLTSCSTSTPGAWVYTYNKAGDLITQRDAKNQTLTFTYDALGRPKVKKQGSQVLVDWTYDTNEMSPLPPGGTYPKGRLIQVRQPVTPTTGLIRTQFAYDKMGRTLRAKRML
jgi:YD repeat-containing protein